MSDFNGMVRVLRDDVLKSIKKYDSRVSSLKALRGKAKYFIDNNIKVRWYHKFWYGFKLTPMGILRNKHTYHSDDYIYEKYCPFFKPEDTHGDVYEYGWGIWQEPCRNQLQAMVQVGTPDLYVTPQQARFIRKFNKLVGLDDAKAA